MRDFWKYLILNFFWRISEACHYSCLTCSGATSTNCLTCDGTNDFRTLQSTTCACNNNYYDNMVAVCAGCHNTCLTCHGPAESDCDSCDSTTDFRTQNSNTCECMTGYRDVGTAVCFGCHYTCTTCGSADANSCQTCNLATNFRSLSNSMCLCTTGYFESSTAICGACDYSCISCSGSLNSNCLTCDSTSDFRSLVQSSCLCNLGYYDKGIAVCSTCHYSCTTCNGITNTTCVSCNTTLVFRSLQKTSCLCNPGYLETGGAICSSCHYSCATCNTTTKLGCLSCSTTQFRNSSNLTSAHTCGCQIGYFDNNVAICAACDQSCLTCTGASNTSCSSCDSTRQRTLQSDNSCPCSQGFQLINNVTLTCTLICDPTCQTCSDATKRGCLTCNSYSPDFRTPSTNNTCVCSNSYYASRSGICTFFDCSKSQYYDEIQYQCGDCHVTCQSCSGPNYYQCSTCLSTSFRTLQNSTQCRCNDGYQDQNTQMQCMQCNDGYKVGNQCYDCHPLCSKCTGGSPLDCTACQTDQYDELNTNQNGQQYYSNSPLNLALNVKSYICKDSKSSELVVANAKNSNYTVSITCTNTKTGELALQQTYQTMIFVLPNQTFLAGYQYSVAITAQRDPSKRMLLAVQYSTVYKTSFNLTILAVARTFSLAGGNREIGLNQNLIIVCLVFDFDHPGQAVDLTRYTFAWICNPISNDLSCLDPNNKTLDTSYAGPNLTVSVRGFVPYNSYQFSVVISDSQDGKKYNASAIYQVVEENVPDLNINFDPNILALSINLNLMQQFKYNYSQAINPDYLFYSANLFYNFDIVSTIIYHYSTINFRIWDYFEGFYGSAGTVILFKGQVYYPRFLRPSTFTITMGVNIPPQQCQIVLTPSQGVELQDLFLISIQNCQTQSGGLLAYRFAYYQSQADYDKDIALQSLGKASLLTSFQSLNYLSTYLPKSVGGIKQIIILGPQIILVLSVQDNKGGVTNITTNMTVTPFPMVNETKLMAKISKIKDTASQLQFLQVISASLRTQNSTFPNLASQMTEIINKTHQLHLTQEQQNQVLQIQSFVSSQVSDLGSLITQQQSNSQSLISQIQAQVNYTKANPSSILNQQAQQVLNNLNIQIDSQHLLGTQILQNLNSQQNSSIDRNSSAFLDLTAQSKQVIAQMNESRQIKLLQMTPNQGTQLLISKYATQAVALTTKKRLGEMLGENVIDDTQTGFLADQSDNTSASYYTFSYLQHASNPYSLDPIFPYADQGFTAIDLQVTTQQTSQVNISSLKTSANVVPTKKVALIINQKKNSTRRLLAQNNSNLNNTGGNSTGPPKVCISSVNATGWSADQCQTKVMKGQISCQCNTINPTSVVSDFNGLFAGANNQIFQASALGAIAHFPWQRVYLFWIIVLITVVYIVMLIIGFKRDKKDTLDKLLQSCDKVGDKVIALIGIDEDNEKNLNKPDGQIDGQNILSQQEKENIFSQEGRGVYQTKKTLISNNTDRLDLFILKGQFQFDGNVILNPQNPRYVVDVESPILRPPSYQYQSSMISAGESEKQKLQNMTLIQYFLINHNYLNVYHSYEPLSRPIRASLLYLCLIQSLAITLYFGSQLVLVRIIILGVLSSIASTIIMMTLKALLSAKPMILKIVGMILFVSFAGFYIFVALGVIATTESIPQTNIWSLQYSISIIYDSTVGAIAPIIIKYKFFR